MYRYGCTVSKCVALMLQSQHSLPPGSEMRSRRCHPTSQDCSFYRSVTIRVVKGDDLAKDSKERFRMRFEREQSAIPAKLPRIAGASLEEHREPERDIVHWPSLDRRYQSTTKCPTGLRLESWSCQTGEGVDVGLFLRALSNDTKQLS